jgi:hypothetical protein
MVSQGTLLTADKVKIAYNHYCGGHDTVVIINHGFWNSKDASEIKTLAEHLIDDYDVFTFDMRGHGKSTGLFTWTSREENDLKAVLDFLKGKYKKIGVVAFSLGAAVSINAYTDYPGVDAMVCISPVADCRKIDYRFWELDLKTDFYYTLISKAGRTGKGVRPGAFWLKKKSPLDSIKKLTIPILYIHGDKDWVVKPWHSQKLYDNTSGEKERALIKNGAHAEYLARDNTNEVVKLIKEWFNKYLEA